MLSLFTLLVSCCFQQVPAQTYNLSIHISNIKSATAPMRIALYDKAEKFPADDAYLLAKVFIPNKTGEVVFVLDGLAAGDYAVAVYQDLDNNSKLNTNFFGYPKEPFCFSNNIHPHFSAPSFKQCRITLCKAQQDIYLKLID